MVAEINSKIVGYIFVRVFVLVEEEETFVLLIQKNMFFIECFCGS